MSTSSVSRQGCADAQNCRDRGLSANVPSILPSPRGLPVATRLAASVERAFEAHLAALSQPPIGAAEQAVDLDPREGLVREARSAPPQGGSRCVRFCRKNDARHRGWQLSVASPPSRALTWRREFKTGPSYYASTISRRSPKTRTNSRAGNLDGLIAPYPERRDLYVARSPVHRFTARGCVGADRVLAGRRGPEPATAAAHPGPRCRDPGLPWRALPPICCIPQLRFCKCPNSHCRWRPIRFPAASLPCPLAGNGSSLPRSSKAH